MAVATDVTTRTATVAAMIGSDTMIVVVSVVTVKSVATTVTIVKVEVPPTAVERSAADMSVAMSVVVNVAASVAATAVEKSDASVTKATVESTVTPAVRSEEATDMEHEKIDVPPATSVNALTVPRGMAPVLATRLPLATAKPPLDLKLVRRTEVRRDYQQHRSDRFRPPLLMHQSGTDRYVH